ncbi:VCBS repeat-containing protein [Sulfidibacter corallicola]|uniref:VCBS repeat-containing protein n=1 Tax=Sulfidibacter corallicola TaxID=2818388 RepID=A0A8A4TVW8_SULCO|nr:FG-GAP-like repeat-containing protein [Sulfidibacter corallicola]QTD54106.1 VCBS repeat-containing protein [Sulfidibacter corallicola]
MAKVAGILALALTLVACERLEVGDPPTFTSSITAVKVSESQIAVSWSAGSDDILDSHELSYGIWVVDKDQDINYDADPTHLTGEGALSYALIGLEANKEFTIGVRARDRGSNYSTTDRETDQSTEAAGSGLFKKETVISVSQTPDDVLSGYINSSSREDLVLVIDDEVWIYESGTDGTLATDPQRIQVGSEISEAWLIRARDNEDYDDLFVLAGGTLYYYESDDGDGFNDRRSPFNRDPEPGTVSFVSDDGYLKALMFIDDGNTGYIYEHDGEGAFSQARSINFNNGEIASLAWANNDNDPDLIVFGANGVEVALGDDDFEFGSRSEVDDDFDRESANHTMFIVDFNGDGTDDICIFDADHGNDPETELRVYQSESDGDFLAGTTTDYKGAFYGKPEFVVLGTTNARSVLFSQTASNTVAVYSGPTDTSVDQTFGGDGDISFATYANLDNANGKDLIMVSRDERKVTVMLANQ